MARRVEVEVIGDTRSLERAMRRSTTATGHLEKGFRGLGRASRIAIGTGIGAGLVGLGLALHAGVKEFQQAQEASAQTAAVIKSTGGAAHVTAKHVTELSNSLLKKTGIDDEVIQQGENMLLTFRGIRNEVGKNNDIFDQATKIGLDMSTAMKGAGFEGGSLKTTMIRLGKALNDPVGGMTALKRVGVTFTKAQVDLVKHLELTGHHLQAQKLILKELRAEFAGSAKAYGQTLAGRLTIIRERLKNLAASVITFLIPAFEKGINILSHFSHWVGRIINAKSLKVGVRIFATGVKDFTSNVGDALRMALLGGMQTVAMSDRGIVQKFHKGLLQQAQEADWKPIGKAIASGFEVSNDALNRMLMGILTWTNSHAGQIAEIGIVIVANIAMKITDPAFWVHHMGLLVGVMALAFGGGLGRSAGRFATAISEKLGGPIALAMMRVVGRLPAVIGDAIAASTGPISRGFVSLFRLIRGPALTKDAEEAGGWLVRKMAQGLRLVVLVTAFRGAFDGIKSVLTRFGSWLEIKGLQLALFLIEPMTHLPSKLGQKAREAKDAINRELNKIQRKHEVTVEVRLRPAGAKGPVTTTGEGVVSMIRKYAAGYAVAHPSAFMTSTGGGGGSRAGLAPAILDDLALGQRMGLSLSSGYRPGAVTSSGNVSLHASGHAIDMVGAPFAMDRYARAEAGRPGVAEVIYSPVGWWHPGQGWSGVSDPAIKRQHYSHVHVGVRGDGIVGARSGEGIVGATPRAAPPSARPLSAPPPSPLAGLRRRIAILRREEQRLKAQIARIDSELRHLPKKKPTKAQAARRKSLESQRKALARRLHAVQAELQSLGQRVQEVLGHDYSALPIDIQLAEAEAALTETPADDLRALSRAEAYLVGQLRRPGITKPQRLQILQALADVRGQIKSITGEESAGAAGAAVTEDQQAILDQVQARTAVAEESARLANAFVATGIFAGSAPSPGSSDGSGTTINMGFLVPDSNQIIRAAEAIAQGAGGQPYRVTSVDKSGY